MRSSAPEQMIEREPVAVPRHQENEQDEREPWDDVLVERVERMFEKMSERDDGQHDAERDQRVARFQSEDDESARDQFDEGNRETDRPQRPHRQKRVREGQKEFADVTSRPEVENLPDAGHEEDQSEHEPREQNGPTPCSSIAHRKMKNTAPRRQSPAQRKLSFIG